MRKDVALAPPERAFPSILWLFSRRRCSSITPIAAASRSSRRCSSSSSASAMRRWACSCRPSSGATRSPSPPRAGSRNASHRGPCSRLRPALVAGDLRLRPRDRPCHAVRLPHAAWPRRKRDLPDQRADFRRACARAPARPLQQRDERRAFDGPDRRARCVGAMILIAYGWRAVFFVLGGVSLLWLIPGSRGAIPRSRPKRRKQHQPASYREILRQRVAVGRVPRAILLFLPLLSRSHLAAALPRQQPASIARQHGGGHRRALCASGDRRGHQRLGVRRADPATAIRRPWFARALSSPAWRGPARCSPPPR